LDKILQNTTVDVAAILNQLAADPVELREQVLAEALLQQMDSTMREMLSRGLVFELPVPRAALAAVCDTIANLENYISRAVALGLLEASHDEALRVPRILPVQLPENGEALHKQAAEVLYRLWWEGTKTASKEHEEQRRVEIHRLALGGKVDKIAVKIAGELASYWNAQSRFQEAVQLCKSTLKIAEHYLVLNQLAYSEQELGEVSKAQEHYLQALDRCPAEDKKEKAAIIHNLGTLKANTGEINESIALLEQSLVITEQIDDAQGKFGTLSQLGILKIDRGEISEALALFDQSFTLAEQIFDVKTKAAHNLASLKVYSGEIDEALALFEPSLALTERIGDVKTKALILRCLGSLKANSGEISEAIAFCEQSLALTEQIGNIQGQAQTLHQLGKLKAYSGEIDEAITLFEQSLTLTERICDVKTKAQTLHQLGKLKVYSDEIDEAITLFEQSLTLTEQICDVKTKAETLHHLGILKAKTGEISDAIALFEQSLTFAVQIGHVLGQAATLSWLGTIAEQQGDYNQALDFLQPALEILQRIQSPDAERVRQMVARVQDLIRNS
jgi:tetratricopeptide (TPR) repeat protein